MEQNLDGNFEESHSESQRYTENGKSGEQPLPSYEEMMGMKENLGKKIGNKRDLWWKDTWEIWKKGCNFWKTRS